jgi:N6-L-threonylcarbamoyladenine synthase
MTLLAIETSCDETSVAVVRDGGVLSNVIASQTAIHAAYGGVVPELATREHLRNFMPVAKEALRQAHVTAAELDAVAATRGPGLPSALLAGLKAAEALAFSLRKPMLGIHHHEAHLYSPWILPDPPRADFTQFEPSVSLIVSGGHTLLVLVEEMFRHRVLGSTRPGNVSTRPASSWACLIRRDRKWTAWRRQGIRGPSSFPGPCSTRRTTILVSRA